MRNFESIKVQKALLAYSQIKQRNWELKDAHLDAKISTVDIVT